jgi:cytochrome b
MTAHAAPDRTKGLLIWDLPLRLFHWMLVCAVLGSWATHKIGTAAFAWHVRCGYAVIVLTAFRILWGLTGPRHARFASFVRGPSGIRRYTRSLIDGDRTQHYAGHNPLGALMVLLMLALLGAQATAGLFANDEVVSSGPLYGYVSDATSDGWSRVHRLGAKAIWIAVWLHIAAVLIHVVVRRDNLIVPMITGRKHGAWLTDDQQIAG